MAELVAGPMLRHVDDSSAAVWVEADTPCTVEVHAGRRVARTRTFTAHRHHYALADVEGLTPGSSTPYTVSLDGRPVWPQPGSPLPPPRIRTLGRRSLRLLIGSCRKVAPHDAGHNRALGVDALRAYAHRLRGAPDAEWPDTLLLVGDQVYADAPQASVRDFVSSRRDTGSPAPPGDELADFEEYAYLYRSAWSDPHLRWLLSTVPSAMLFDDHDIRDDWNTSQAWREAMRALPWWRDRITGGLGAYWLYQHLGNMSPAERAADPVLAQVLRYGRDGRDAGPVLDELALAVDDDPEAYRWSYHRDMNGCRLAALDTRCGRVLEPGRRDILDPTEWAWFDRLATGGVDHLLVASSLPYLLPPAVHHAERWNEEACDGGHGPRVAAAAERLRQGIDLEHWSAFRRSFDAMARVATEVAAGARGDAPGTVLFLSGDVHYSYLARVVGADGSRPPIYQAVCSPIRNSLPAALRWASALACTRAAGAAGRLFADLTGTPRTPLRWRMEHGPWFRNALLTVDIDGRECTLRWEAAVEGAGEPGLQPLRMVQVP